MRTDELISLLEKDAEISPRRGLMAFLFVGFMAAVLGLFALPLVSQFSIRPNYFSALTTGFVPFKQILPLLLAFTLYPRVRELDSPLSKVTPFVLLPFAFLALAMFAMGYFFEPEAGRAMAVRGKSLPYCLTLVPVFALPSFVMIFMMLRRGAPSNAMASGFYAGLLAGAVGCFVYAFICVDDNPLFWSWAYSLGMIICGIIGAVAGRALLRW